MEFVNFTTGAAVLLGCDGEWSTGGAFRVFYLAPSGDISEASALLWHMKLSFEADPNDWLTVKRGCIGYLAALLDAEPAPPWD